MGNPIYMWKLVNSQKVACENFFEKIYNKYKIIIKRERGGLKEQLNINEKCTYMKLVYN